MPTSDNFTARSPFCQLFQIQEIFSKVNSKSYFLEASFNKIPGFYNKIKFFHFKSCSWSPVPSSNMNRSQLYSVHSIEADAGTASKQTAPLHSERKVAHTLEPSTRASCKNIF